MIPNENGSGTPDPEVVERAKRRQFTAGYKLAILEEFDGCEKSAERGALLRREGLYRSHITTWHQQRNAGQLAGLAPRKRGRKATKQRGADAAELARLRRENARLERRLKQAELLIEIQKKVSQALSQQDADDAENS